MLIRYQFNTVNGNLITLLNKSCVNCQLKLYGSNILYKRIILATI